MTCASPAAPDGAIATKGIGQGDLVDTGNTCWDPPTTFFFVKNSVRVTSES